jgi:hypothetical protein
MIAAPKLRKIFNRFKFPPGQARLPLSIIAPFEDHPGVLRVMAVRIKAQAMAEAGFPDELLFRHPLDEVDELAVGFIPLAEHLIKR